MQSGPFVCPEHDHLFAGLRTTGPGTMSSPRQRTLMHRVAIVLGLLFAGLEQVSNAFVFRIPPSKLATCRENDPTACAMAMVAESWQLLPSSERSSRAQGAEDLHRQRYRGQTITRVGPGSAVVPLRSGMGASVGGGLDQNPAEDEDMGMAPVDLDQAMGSFSPEWDNTTARDDPKKHLIKGSVIAANQTEFAYPLGSFPPLINSEVYYNGTAERYWWNQNSDAVCVYVPVPEGFDPKTVEFTAKTKQLSLKFGGEEILSGTLFYRIDGYESLYVVDSQNDPPYVQLELFKVREFQNWEDLIIEKSSFSPGGAQ